VVHSYQCAVYDGRLEYLKTKVHTRKNLILGQKSWPIEGREDQISCETHVMF
jgi:hypothetical protein